MLPTGQCQLLIYTDIQILSSDVQIQASVLNLLHKAPRYYSTSLYSSIDIEQDDEANFVRLNMLTGYTLSTQCWLSGRILARHAEHPGSIPGPRASFLPYDNVCKMQTAFEEVISVSFGSVVLKSFQEPLKVGYMGNSQY